MSPAPATRYDRDAIITIALRLLDDVGLPDLTMRRLATELGVQPSALYWHFANKQELLAGVADRIVERLPEATSDPLSTATAVRDALLAYRDGAEVVMSSYALGFGAAAIETRLTDALRPLADDATTAATALSHFILGHAFLLQQRMHADSYGASASDDSLNDWAATFSHGVRVYLAGLSHPATR